MNSSSEASMKLSDWIGNPQWRRLKEFQRRVAQRRRGSGLPNEPIGMFPNGKWVDGRIPLFLLPCNYAALQLIHHQLSLSHFQSFLAKESIHRQFRLIHGGAIAIPKLLRMELDWSETKMTGRLYHPRQKFIQRISRFASRLTTVNPGLNRNEEKSTETYSWSQIYQTKERMGKRVDPHLSRLSSKGGQSTIAVRNELQPPVKERHTNAKPTPLHDSILRGARLISTSAASSFFSHWTHLSSNQKVIACRNAGNETLFFFPIRDFLMNFLFVSLPEVSEETKATAIKHRVQWYSIRSSQLIPSWVWCRQKKKNSAPLRVIEGVRPISRVCKTCFVGFDGLWKDLLPCKNHTVRAWPFSPKAAIVTKWMNLRKRSRSERIGKLKRWLAPVLLFRLVMHPRKP